MYMIMIYYDYDDYDLCMYLLVGPSFYVSMFICGIICIYTYYIHIIKIEYPSRVYACVIVCA